jgi:hypothetical protein
MIISKLHRFIFVAIPKTGTHSVRQALREQMGPEDMEQVGLFVQKSLPIPDLAKIRHGHLTLSQLRPHLDADTFDNFFKFAFVRNPFDRFVSYCSFVTRQKGQFDRNPRAVMEHFVAKPPWDHILSQPQHQFLIDEQGKLLTDYVGRVEQMQESYDAIAQRIGIPTAVLERVNSSRRADYRDYYDDELIEGVAKLYARDLELFGYQF